VFAEASVRRPEAMLPALAEELRRLAGWLELGDILVEAQTPLANLLKKQMT
jgi:uncharacterized protein YcaQ